MTKIEGMPISHNPAVRYAGRTVAACLLCFAAAVVKAAPSLETGPTSHDFGTLRNDQTVKHSFTLENNGNQPLRIDDIHSSCGCTSAVVEPNPIPAGETAQLMVVLNLHGRSGPQNQKVTLSTNDPGNPGVRFNIQANALAVAEFEPSYLSFGRIQGTSRATRELTVGTLADVKLECQGFAEGTAKFEVKQTGQKVADTGRNITVYEITVKPGLPAGIHRGTLVFHSEDEKPRNYSVSVSAWVLDLILVAPRQLRLRHGTENIKRYIRITPGKIKEFSVTGIRTPSPEIKAVSEVMEDGTCLIRLEELSGKSELDGKAIEIYTDVPGKEMIRIPIHIFNLH